MFFKNHKKISQKQNYALFMAKYIIKLFRVLFKRKNDFFLNVCSQKISKLLFVSQKFDLLAITLCWSSRPRDECSDICPPTPAAGEKQKPGVLNN